MNNLKCPECQHEADNGHSRSCSSFVERPYTWDCRYCKQSAPGRCDMHIYKPLKPTCPNPTAYEDGKRDAIAKVLEILKEMQEANPHQSEISDAIFKIHCL